jgi:hypothetical protein
MEVVEAHVCLIKDNIVKAADIKRCVFGNGSSFFPRGHWFNILEEQFHAVKAFCAQTSIASSTISWNISSAATSLEFGCSGSVGD